MYVNGCILLCRYSRRWIVVFFGAHTRDALRVTTILLVKKKKSIINEKKNHWRYLWTRGSGYDDTWIRTKRVWKNCTATAYETTMKTDYWYACEPNECYRRTDWPRSDDGAPCTPLQSAPSAARPGPTCRHSGGLARSAEHVVVVTRTMSIILLTTYNRLRKRKHKYL